MTSGAAKVPKEGLASTKLVDVETGIVRAEFGFTIVPGAGLQGVVTRYSDHREIGGLWFSSVQDIALPGAPGKVGATRLTTSHVETKIAGVSETLRPPGL